MKKICRNLVNTSILHIFYLITWKGYAIIIAQLMLITKGGKKNATETTRGIYHDNSKS